MTEKAPHVKLYMALLEEVSSGASEEQFSIIAVNWAI